MLYYVRKKETETGPFTKGQILNMFENGSITADAEFADESRQTWYPVTMLAEQYSEPKKGKVKRVSEHFGMGCAVQTLGLFFLVAGFYFWPLFVLAVVFLLAGSGLSVKYVCSLCGNKLDKNATICPVCKSTLN